MVLISFTNVVVDEFSYGKRNPLKKYIYFLTHMHSDHYQGITPNWNYGPIYCSKVTKKLLLLKFPRLPDVRELPMDCAQRICLHEENKIEIMVYLFDANHCPGSVMFMFEGYFGRILHTGDMRFNESLIVNNPILFPVEKRNKELMKCSLQVDECIFDNTYCDPIFKFPRRDKACELLVEIIEKNMNIPNVRFLICVDSLGKEELLVFLSQKFQTLIVLNEQRYQGILCMDIPHHLFTTNRDQGWIEVIRKGEKYERLSSKTEHCISITCTGWANIQGYITRDERDYLLPYSLHSNFEELELFIRSVFPGVLNTVVRNTSKSEKINNITQFSSYMITLMNLKQRGVEFFQKTYVDPTVISKEYSSLMMDASNISKINKALGLELTEEQQIAEDVIEFQSKHAQIFKNKTRLAKGAKLQDPSNNSSFDFDKFNKIKKEIQELKEQQQQSSQSKNSKKRSDIYQEITDETNRNYDSNNQIELYGSKKKEIKAQNIYTDTVQSSSDNQNKELKNHQITDQTELSNKIDNIRKKLYSNLSKKQHTNNGDQNQNQNNETSDEEHQNIEVSKSESVPTETISEIADRLEKTKSEGDANSNKRFKIIQKKKFINIKMEKKASLDKFENVKDEQSSEEKYDNEGNYGDINHFNVDKSQGDYSKGEKNMIGELVGNTESKDNPDNQREDECKSQINNSRIEQDKIEDIINKNYMNEDTNQTIEISRSSSNSNTNRIVSREIPVFKSSALNSLFNQFLKNNPKQ